MSDRHEAELARLQKIRDAGIWRFVLLRGVLLWGLGGGVLGLVGSLPVPGPRHIVVPLTIGMFALCGLIWGFALWFITMRLYVRYQKSIDS